MIPVCFRLATDASETSRPAIPGARYFFSAVLLLGTAASAHALESVLAFADPMAAAGDATAVSANLHYFAGNDPLALREYIDSWQGAYHPRDGRNLGLLSQRAEIAVQVANWRVGAFQRQEALVDSSRGATDIFLIYKSRSQAAAGQMFAVDAGYQAFDATGWRLDKAWRWNMADDKIITFGVGYSILQGHRVRAGSANGSVTSLGAGKYSYTLGFNEADTRKIYPFQTPGQPEGQGDAWDIGVSLKDGSGLRLDILANDLLANIRWRDIPSTTARANTGVTTTDANGYIVYAPTLSGRNFRRDFTQELPPRYAVGAELPWRNFTVFGSLARQQGINFPLAGAAWAFAEKWRLQADYDFRFGSTELKLVSPAAFLALRASQWNLSEAGAYGLSAGMHWELP